VSTVAGVDTTFVRKKMEALSLGESLTVPSPDVPVPPIQKNASREERIRRMRSSPFYNEVARVFEETRKPETNYEGMRFSIDTSPHVLKKEKVEIESGTDVILNRLNPVTEETFQGGGEEGNLAVSGPVARRELAYVPPIPEVDVTGETEFEIKFWVRPNGTVDRVAPLNRTGGVELERVATNYLRKWRFTPLSDNEPQVEEWGTVTITFRGQ
jgi:TonB family protein